MNKSTQLLGIAQSNIQSYKDGIIDPITALSFTYDTITKEYSFSPTATFTTTDNFVVTLYDSVTSTNVAIIGTKFYKGQSPTIVPIA